MKTSGDRINISPAVAALLVTPVALLSYTVNLFRAVPEELRLAYQSNHGSLLVEDAWRAGESMLGMVGSAGFEPYVSSFGGQVHLYRLFSLIFGADLDAFRVMNAILLALIVGTASFFVGRRLFGGAGGVAFGLTLSLSPWMILFSQSLYWVMWLSVLPLLASLWLGERAFRSRRPFLFFVTLLYAPFLIRFLCGYEYSSSIVIYAAAPAVFLGFNAREGFLPVLRAVLGIGVAAIAAMATAMVLHAMRVDDSLMGGFEVIRATAEKRLVTRDIGAVVQAQCEAAAERDQCVQEYERSLSAPLPVVLMAYLTFRRTVPWLAGPDIIDSPDLEPVRRAFRALNPRAVLEAMRPLGLHGVIASANLFLTMVVAWVLVLLAALKLTRRRPGRTPAVALLLVSAAAPLSWYVIAKAHSYAHMHVNFVLWAPFLAFVLAYLASSSPPQRPRSPDLPSKNRTTRSHCTSFHILQ